MGLTNISQPVEIHNARSKLLYEVDFHDKQSVVLAKNLIIYRVRENGATLFLALTLPNTNRFQFFFTGRLSSKFLETLIKLL